MTLASALLWPASSFNPGHQTHSEAGPGAEALHCGGSLHPGWPDCPNTSPPALSMVPSYKPHIELGPMALMGFPPMTCGEQGGWMAALYRRTEGSPPGPGEGESFRATLEYLLECIPQVLICVLPERVQILPHGAREENWVLWIDGYRKRRPWPVKIMTRGKMHERVKTSFIERR